MAPAQLAERAISASRHCVRAALAWGLTLASMPLFAVAQTLGADGPLPSFAALQAAGAVVGEIRIVNEDVFDLNDPAENNALFRLANRLHIQTRSSVIRGSLLFKRGDPVSVRVIDETERLLRARRYIFDVRLRPVMYRDGVVDIEVMTRDTWSLDPGISVGRSGGATSSSVVLREYNLLGTGLSVSLGHSRNVDRSGNEFQFQYDRAFDGWTTLSYSQADNSDGKRRAASLWRPFYALDTRWAAGAMASTEDRVDSVYGAGIVTSQYRHRQGLGEVFGGWSGGLVSGWTQRYTVGVQARDDIYKIEPGVLAPRQLPPDQKMVAPFVRFEVIEDEFHRLSNRNQIGRPEFFAMGLASVLQLGRATTGMGSSRNAWVISGSVSKGFEPRPQHELLTSASLSGQYGAGRLLQHSLNASARYYLPLTARYLLYGSAAIDVVKTPDLSERPTLGGDTGLRGYPLRYQTGERRAVFTGEFRGYSDVYLFHLFRIGGAAFYDLGRAWSAADGNAANPRWLSDVGVGLRIFNVRAAFGNVLHLDLAVPLHRDPGIKSVQFLVKTKASF